MRASCPFWVGMDGPCQTGRLVKRLRLRAYRAADLHCGTFHALDPRVREAPPVRAGLLSHHMRTVPRSRRNPQFNEDVLGSELADYQVGYERIAALGGLRGRSPDVPKAANAFWNNESFQTTPIMRCRINLRPVSPNCSQSARRDDVR